MNTSIRKIPPANSVNYLNKIELNMFKHETMRGLMTNNKTNHLLDISKFYP